MPHEVGRFSGSLFGAEQAKDRNAIRAGWWRSLACVWRIRGRFGGRLATCAVAFTSFNLALR